MRRVSGDEKLDYKLTNGGIFRGSMNVLKIEGGIRNARMGNETCRWCIRFIQINRWERPL